MFAILKNSSYFGVGATSKKYVVDPSVAGNAPYRSPSAMSSPYNQPGGMYGNPAQGFSTSAQAPYNFQVSSAM